MIDFKRANAGSHFRIRLMRCEDSFTVTVCTFTALALVSEAAGFDLVACSNLDPRMPVPPKQKVVVIVGADLYNSGQATPVYVHAQNFGRVRWQTKIVGIHNIDDWLRAVRNGAILVSFDYTGELLGLDDPASVALLMEEHADDSAPGKRFSGKRRDRAYDTSSRSLLSEVMATSASIAQGCANALTDNTGTGLPQWLVPFYAKPTLNRDNQVRVLSEIVGSLDTEDLELTTRVTAGGTNPELATQE